MTKKKISNCWLFGMDVFSTFALVLIIGLNDYFTQDKILSRIVLYSTLIALFSLMKTIQLCEAYK